jgi:hypothetical protein
MATQLSLAEQLRPFAARARLYHPRIRQVVQITAFLGGDDWESSADEARHETLRWLHKRAGPLPSHAWDGTTFEREVAPGHSAYAVSLTEPAPYWVARLDHPDADVPGRTWSTEVTVGISPQGAQFGVRLSCVSRRDDPDVELSTPGIALQVAGRPGLQDFGVPLTSEPWMLETTDDVHRLLELIENPRRTRPVYVASLPDGKVNPATAFVECGSLARRCLGIAHVVILPSPLSFELTNQVGKEHSVFGGAVRSYFPGFAVEDQTPRKHPLALPARIVDWVGGGARAFEDLLVRRAYEYSTRRPDLEDRLPSFTRVRKIALSRRQFDLERGGDQKAIIINLQAQNQELSREAETWEALATEEMNQRRHIQDEADQLKAQNEWMRTELDRLRLELQKLTGSRADAPVPFPTELGKLAEWAHEAVPGRLTLSPRAIKAAKQGLYRETRHVFNALLLLANEYRDMKVHGGPERKSSFERALQELGLRCEPTFSGSRYGEFGDTYFVDWSGQRRLLDMHLKNGGNTRDPTRCLRIYFFWDDDEQQVIVGSLPGHLDTRLT